MKIVVWQLDNKDYYCPIDGGNYDKKLINKCKTKMFSGNLSAYFSNKKINLLWSCVDA